MKIITKAQRFGYTRRRSLSVYTRTLRVSAAADFFRSRSRFDDDFFLIDINLFVMMITIVILGLREIQSRMESRQNWRSL